MIKNEMTSQNSPYLPNKAETTLGKCFSPRDDIWVIWSASRTYYFNFVEFEGVNQALIPEIKAVLCWYLQNYSPSTASAIFFRLKEFFRQIGRINGVEIRTIRDVELISYHGALGRENEHVLGALASFIKHWHAFGYSGVEKSAVVFLDSVRLRGGPKGEAVRTMDPFDGPFTDVEFEGIQVVLTEAFRKGDISLADYLATWLFILIGARPVQITMLRVRDVITTRDPDGILSYALNVPRAKQQAQGLRDEFKLRPVAPQIGELLAHYAHSLEEKFADFLRDPGDAPLFPLTGPNRNAPAGMEWHMTAADLSGRVRKAFSSIAPKSERTGVAIRLTPTRFRRTLGTRAAVEGHGVLVIAELLDHSDTQNAGVYVEARPEIIDRIDKAIAVRMAPLAQAFAGTLVTSAPDSGPRITDPRFDSAAPVGSCGKHSHCAFSAPIACYTCADFHAWADGPHEAVLEFLIAEEERLLSITDGRIALVNRRTILAVAEVVRLCDEQRQQALPTGAA